MGVFATNEEQLSMIFSSSSIIAKRTLGYIQGIEKEVQTIDIETTNLGDTIWVELAGKLNCGIKDLLSLDSHENTDLREAEMSNSDWLKVLNKNPALLRNPILISGNKYMQIRIPYNSLLFFGIDSSGLVKKHGDELPETSSNTDDENFRI